MSPAPSALRAIARRDRQAASRRREGRPEESRSSTPVAPRAHFAHRRQTSRGRRRWLKRSAEWASARIPNLALGKNRVPRPKPPWLLNGALATRDVQFGYALGCALPKSRPVNFVLVRHVSAYMRKQRQWHRREAASTSFREAVMKFIPSMRRVWREGLC
jgi:hypothetical protein